MFEYPLNNTILDVFSKFNAHLTASLGAIRIQQPVKAEEVTAVTSKMYCFKTDIHNVSLSFSTNFTIFRMPSYRMNAIIIHV